MHDKEKTMTQPAACGSTRTGLFLNPAAQRRADFQVAGGELFGRLLLAGGVDEAAAMLAQHQVDLLVLDLDRFEHGSDLAALGALVASRAGAPTLLLCPFTNGRWLASLMAFGPVEYAIGPLARPDLRALLEARLEARPGAAMAPTPKETELRELAALRSRVQDALAGADDPARLGQQLCQGLHRWPGVVHSSLFCLKEGGDLQLEAEHGDNGLELARLFGRADRLLQSPLRAAFPGLLAAAGGELALLDALDKAGDPELVRILRGHGVEMAVGVPIPGPGAPRGALCLLFGRRAQFAPEQLAMLAELAQLAGFGLRLADMNRETEQLTGRLTHLATVDALTGVANRRHGEDLLEQEIRRTRRYKLPLALIAFDLDRFKAINDRYGHPVGDVALRTVAEAAQSVLRSSDVLVRAGGEEFQVIAPHTSAIDGLRMAEKLRQAIEQTAVPGCDQVTVSLGVAQLGEQESSDSLTVRVVAALGRAKRAGRNCVELAMQ
jgi:diguanylate cyclase (GGDEF)-like protein